MERLTIGVLIKEDVKNAYTKNPMTEPNISSYSQGYMGQQPVEEQNRSD